MRGGSKIDPKEFVGVLRPRLEAQDLPGLIENVRARWTPADIRSLLRCRCHEARKMALLSLSWVGQSTCIPDLATALKDVDPMINGMAEHALWSIWFRLGTEEANHELCRGSQALERQELPCAIKHFTKAAELDPTFAEAYNQRAIANFLLERHEQSLKDCALATKLMPCHFGAFAGMGHCHLHLGQLKHALTAYEKALELNPHLECVAESIEELKEKLDSP